MKKDGGKQVDSVKLKRKHSISISTNKSSATKIKLNKPNKNTLIRFIPVLSALSIALLLVLMLMQTRAYQIFRLASKIKNETILVGFQNSAELRPTGGFWGSFALLDIGNNISQSKISFDTNPYKQDNQFLESSKAKLPEPMAKIWTDRPQSFVNANWFIDFKDSAKTLEWYFAQGWGKDKKIDGVVAVSSLSMIDLLDLIGPVTASDGTILNSANFTQTMSEKIDEDYWDNPENKVINEPKTIIKEIFPQILSKTRNLSKLKLYNFLQDQVNKGRILAYFNDGSKQSLAKEIGMSGEILSTNSDYISINNANIAGHKSSLNVYQKIDYKVNSSDGVLTADLTLTRDHVEKWPYAVNTNYTRIMTPLGSKVVSATMDGKNVTQEIKTTMEGGKTVFGLWMSTPSGKQKKLEINYLLPFTKDAKYSLIYQKQPGTNPDWINVDIFDKVIYAGSVDRTYIELKDI